MATTMTEQASIQDQVSLIEDTDVYEQDRKKQRHESTEEKEEKQELPNNLVAESDLKAAVDGINAYYDSHLPINNSSSRSSTLQAPSSIPLSTMSHPFFQSAKISMIDKLRQIVQPIPDSEFHQHVERFHPQEIEVDDEDDDENDDSDADSVEEDYEDHTEYEEEDLLDPHALEQAQALREQVRLLAARAQSLRNRVLTKNASINTKKLQSKYQMEADVPPKLELSPSGPQQDLVCKASWNQLVQILDNSQIQALPKTVESFQETLGVIQDSLAKTQPSSQVEHAILSRERDDDDEEELQSSQDKTNALFLANKAPQTRLAHFLQG